MKFKKLIGITAAAAVAGSACVIPAAAAESTTKKIEAWTSDFNVEVAADSGSSGTYQAKYGETIFGKVRAAGKNDITAKNAGLDLRMTPSSGTEGISKASAGSLYLVKTQSDADGDDYALGVLGTTAELKSDSISLSDGDTFSLSYDTYAVETSSSMAKTTTVTLKDTSGKSLISYTYTPYEEGLITDVKIGGKTVSGFIDQSAHSWRTNGNSLTTIADLSIDNNSTHKNPRITFTIKADGTASLNIIRDKAGSAEAVDKTYTGTIDANAAIGSFTISNGNGEDGSRVYTIDNLVTTVTSEPTEPKITVAEEYSDVNFTDPSVKGFTAVVNAAGNETKSIIWYASNNSGDNWVELATDSTTQITDGTAKFGAVFYNIPGDTDFLVGYEIK